MTDERINRLENEVAELRVRITSLRDRAPQPAAPAPDAASPTASDLASRRGMLKLAGAAIVGVAATSTVVGMTDDPSPVAAATAPSFHPISPIRVFDSRAPLPAPGPLASPQTRDVSVADGRDLVTGAVSTAAVVPTGTTAIACNVTVSGTVGAGYLTVNPGGNKVVAASTINWFGPDQTLANGVIVTVSTDLKVTVIAGGGGSTDFVLDITGYFQ